MTTSALQLLRTNSDVRRVYLSRIISFGGDWFLIVPLFGLVHEISGDPFLTTAVLAANSLPAFVFSPWAGTLADRLNRKKLMVYSDLAASLVVLSLLFVDDLRSVPLALIGIAAVATANAFFTPASSAALPNLVHADDLAKANLLVESTWGTMAAIGSFLGGIVAGWLGRDAAFIIDAASFAIAALLLSRIERPVSTGPRMSRQPMLTALREAGRYAARHRPVAALLTTKAGFGLFGAGGTVLLPLLSLEVFLTGDSGTGFLWGARGVGVVVGPFLVRRLLAPNDRTLLELISWSMVFWGLGYLAVALSPTLALAALAVGLGHMGGGCQWTFSSYGLQLLTEDKYRGRIFGFDFAAVTLSMTLSTLVAGWAANHYTIRSVIAALAIFGMVFGTTWGFVTKKFWRDVAPQTR